MTWIEASAHLQLICQSSMNFFHSWSWYRVIESSSSSPERTQRELLCSMINRDFNLLKLRVQSRGRKPVSLLFMSRFRRHLCLQWSYCCWRFQADASSLRPSHHPSIIEMMTKLTRSQRACDRSTGDGFHTFLATFPVHYHILL